MTLVRHDGPFGNALLDDAARCSTCAASRSATAGASRATRSTSTSTSCGTRRARDRHPPRPLRRRAALAGAQAPRSSCVKTAVHERVVVLGDINEWLPLGAAAALAERAPRPLGRRALVPVALAAVRARPRLGAAAPCAARPQGAPLAARVTRLRPPAGQGDHRDAESALGAQPAAARAASARRRQPLRQTWRQPPAAGALSFFFGALPPTAAEGSSPFFFATRTFTLLRLANSLRESLPSLVAVGTVKARDDDLVSGGFRERYVAIAVQVQGHRSNGRWTRRRPHGLGRPSRGSRTSNFMAPRGCSFRAHTSSRYTLIQLRRGAEV